MSVKRLQNRIAESRFTLPATAALTLMAWIAAEVLGLMDVVSLPVLFIIISTYLMVELNNNNALIRIYSRTVSCSFLLLALAASPRLVTMKSAIVMLSMIATWLILFHAYQQRQGHGTVYFAFLCLGIGSTVFAPILYLVPFLWFIVSFNLMAASFKNWLASILGTFTPYWFIATYYIYIGDFTYFSSQLNELTGIDTILHIEGITLNHILTYALTLILATTGIVHYLRTRFNDNIRTRMIYDAFITVDIIALVLCVLFPSYYCEWLAIAIVNTAPLIGHYIALTRTWMTNISFYIYIVALAAVTLFNLWMPSFQFL